MQQQIQAQPNRDFEQRPASKSQRAAKCVTFASIALALFLPGHIAAAPPAPATLSLSESGLGPIKGTTPFDRAILQGLLPGWSVTSSQAFTEGEPYPILNIADRGGRIATIHPQDDRGKIHSIVVLSHRIRNLLGPGIGTQYSTIYPKGTKTCHPGMEEESGTVRCLAPGSHHIYYQFIRSRTSTYQGPDGSLPPEAELRSWKIQLIYWLA